MALGAIAQRAPVRMADGGSLLSTALDAVTTPDPSGQSRIVNPYPGDYLTYGEGPEWNWFDYLNSAGNPPPTTTPPPSAGGTGGTGTGGTGPAGGGPGTGVPSGGSPAGGGNGFGGKGQFGGGNQQAAADAAARNVAQNPSLKDALKMASSFIGPMGAFSLLGKTALSQFGIGQNPFNDPNVQTMSADQIASIQNSLNNIPDSLPAVQRANLINNAIQAARAMGSGTSANTGSGIGQAGNQPATGGINLAGLAGRMGGGGGGGNSGGGGGIGGNGPMGGQGGQGANAGFASGGTARMKGLGWLANGGRLHMAGGGSSNNSVLTSLLPIAAGLIGNIVSGPIGGAVASGAATAMTGGSLQDALVNSGPDTIDSFFKYFAPLLGYGGTDQPQQANTNSGQSTVSPAAAAFLKAMTQPAPVAADQTVLPYTKPSGMAGGGELDARGGTHVDGPGDGQSDDIPAKLSQGEFVWSAQDVSDLGNGSNKAGADRLEEMRRMVRARAGRKNVHTIAPKQKSVAHLLHAVTKGKAA